MSEKYPLQETLSPIDKKGRDRLNENWTRIMAYFDHVQLQIKALAGGHEVDELIARLEEAIVNAETDLQNYIAQVDTTVQEAIDANNTATQDAINANNMALQTALQTISSKLTELNTAIRNTETATSDANAAKNAAIQATQDAQNAINKMQSLIDNFGSRGAWSATTQYYKNNLAEVEGRTYIALKDNINTPVTDKSTWALFADKGAKGDKGEKGDTGAALSILGRLTDPSQLPPTGEAGYAYTVDGELYVWSENLDAWENVGNIKGEKGDKGDTGEDGLSAYEVAVENGYIGTSEEWLASLKGERGEIGKMTKYEYTIPATSEGQTTLEIPLSTLSVDDDLLVVLNGTVLYPDTDYTLSGSIVNLKQPVLDYSNSTFFVRVLKNIPKDSEVPTTDGSLLTDGSVAKQKLELSLQHEINITTDHLDVIATRDKLGHIKPDGETITVDPETGIASASPQEQGYQLTESNGYAKDITGVDLNTVIESGFYKSVDGVTTNNFPKDFIGGYNLSIENIQTANNWTYQTLVSSTFAGTTIWKRARVSGNWNTWKEIFPNKLDSGNVNLTPGTGWKVDLLTSSLSFREVNGIVFVKAYNIVPQTGYVNVITTLPLGYRPLNRTIVFSYDAGGVPYQAKILNTGQITLYSAQNTTLVGKAVDFEFSFSIFE